MIRFFLKTLGTHFRAGRSLYVLTVLGVALGVASVLSIQIINRNALAAFAGTVKAISGTADLTISPAGTGLPDTLVTRVLATPGVAAASPLYRADVAVEGTRERLDIVGLDFYAPVDLALPDRTADPADALTRPGWVAVTPAYADEMGWSVGDAIAVTEGSRRAVLTVGDLVDFQRATPLASRRLAIMDIAQAQSLFGGRGEIHQIDVRLTPEADAADVVAALREALGPGARIRSPEQRERDAAGLLRAFRLNLTALSSISVFVGIFLVYSSTQAALVRRRAEFGVLRSVGASRRQILALILGEVSLLGLLGVGIGLPLGFWGAAANVDVVSATLTNLYLLQEIEALELPRWIVPLAVLVGLGGALAGAAAPALDMARRDTRALLAAYTLHERVGTMAPGLFAAGLGVCAGTAAWYALLGSAWQPAGFVLAAALGIALPLLTPLLVLIAGNAVRIRGFGWSYAFKTLGVRLQESAVAVAALAIAVSMLVGVTLMIGSFRKTLDVWIASSVRADVYVSTASWRGRGGRATLDSAIVAGLAGHPGVRSIDRLRSLSGYAGDRRIGIAGVDAGLPGGEARFPLVEGRYDRVFVTPREDAVLISEPLSRKTGLRTGDTIPVSGPLGAIPFTVAGVYYDYGDENGALVTSHATLARHFGPGEFNSVALYLAPGFTADDVIADLRERFDTPLVLRSNRRLREEALRVFDQTFAVTRLLQAMGLVVAVGGVTLTLLVLVRQRVSELALYRALGATRTQIFRVFLGKGLGLSVMGMLIGAAGGIALAAILIFVINPAFFGWTIQPSAAWQPVALQLATIAAAGVGASVYPALRASRTPASELSRENV